MEDLRTKIAMITKSSRPTGPRRRPERQERRRPAPRVHRTPLVREAPPLDPKSDVIRIIPLGGVEEIGKNMTLVEFKDDIIIVDMGLQFPGDEAPGVDYIIPDTSYLEKRKNKIRGVFITHGHLDHIGGIPYMLPKLGNPPVYTRLLTSVMIKKRHAEFVHLPQPNLQVIESEVRLRAGRHLSVRTFNVTHTIPDAMGIIIETPFGNIVFTGDFKIDHDNGVPVANEEGIYGNLSKDNNLLLLADSTNAERPGFSFSERAVHENLRKIIADMKGRLIMGTFASLLERIIFVIKTAEEMGKKIVIEGRSMKVNTEIAKELKMLQCDPHTFIPASEMDKYPPEKIIVLATGAQGDEYAALMRMANKKHAHVTIHKGDTVLLSSSVIPGNEKNVQKLKDNLSRQGAKIIHYRVADVHSSGHAHADETAWIMKMIKPKFFIPVHGSHFMLRVHGDIAESVGIPRDHIVIPDNGSIVEITQGGEKIQALKEKVPIGIVMVDALGQGDINEVVIRDRQMLSQDGIFVIITVIDIKTGKVKNSPDIISRGFVYLKESQILLKQSRYLTRRIIEEAVQGMHPINFDYVRNQLRERMGRFLFKHTGKRPIILPVILEV